MTMVLMAFGKLTASNRSANMTIQSIASKPHLGFLSLFSTACPLVAASNKPSRTGDHFGRFILPTTILPSSPVPSNPAPENLVWKSTLQGLQKKKKEEVNYLQRMLDSLRIVQLPTSKPTTMVVPHQPTPQQQHTFQAMNRNARKPKRANHGKRPCSRIRRRYKFKKWANTSRRG
mmetsp:Transcript_28541/g.60499  ORF Transcript_28541/g.60499 Transcript_28541/m.60499 type:complete len:175 (+) Transcript_28541:45-569(+)